MLVCSKTCDLHCVQSAQLCTLLLGHTTCRSKAQQGWTTVLAAYIGGARVETHPHMHAQALCYAHLQAGLMERPGEPEWHC